LTVNRARVRLAETGVSFPENLALPAITHFRMDLCSARQCLGALPTLRAGGIDPASAQLRFSSCVMVGDTDRRDRTAGMARKERAMVRSPVSRNPNPSQSRIRSPDSGTPVRLAIQVGPSRPGARPRCAYLLGRPPPRARLRWPGRHARRSVRPVLPGSNPSLEFDPTNLGGPIRRAIPVGPIPASWRYPSAG
jgi:hypothetical protein